MSVSASHWLRYLRWYWNRLPRMPRRRKSMLVAIYLFWQERFTPAGKVIAALWLFLVFLESLPGLSGLWPLLVLLTSAFVVAGVSSWRAPEGDVTLEFPGRLRCGDAEMLRGVPSGCRPHSHLGCFPLHDALRCGESTSEEPWLVSVHALAVGRFPVGHVTLLKSEPLGLMRARHHCIQNTELIVHPRPAHLARLDFLVHGASGRYFQAQMGKRNQRGDDFIGIRPYRPGDSRRDLHHMAWARHGQPFTREFAPEEGGGIFLALESECRQSIHWPATLQLTAGIALWLASRRLLAGLWLGGRLMNAGPRFYPEAILDMLAEASQVEHSQELPSFSAPVLILGCSRSSFLYSQQNPRKGRMMKRIGIGTGQIIPADDAHLWLDGFDLREQLDKEIGIHL